MTYNPNTPLPVPSPAVQQPQIKTNFSKFASIYSSASGGVTYNHTPLNSGNQGKHEAIIIQDNITDAEVTNDYVALYNKAGNLFERIPKFSRYFNFPMQLTYNTVDTSGPQFQSFLPGGYLYFFGSISGIAPSNANIVNTITLSPSPSLILCPIAAANSMTVPGTPQPCAIGTSIVPLPTKNEFIITMQSPGTGQNYSLTWFCIAKV